MDTAAEELATLTSSTIVRDVAEDGLVRIVYVRSKAQHSDILTKDLDMRTFELRAKALMNLK